MSHNEPISQSPEPEINDLIKQAELMQIKLQLDVQFKKNMAFFKQTTPKIYEQYVDYQPKDQKLYYSEDGYLNLLNIASGKPAFGKDPKDFAQEQIDYFVKKPTIFKLDFSIANPWNDHHIHVPYTNKIINYSKTHELKKEPDVHSPIGLLVMVGCGLGYQIEALLDQANIYNLFIYDSKKDSFFASLHTIDWKNIVDKINRKKGTIKIVIGETYFDALSYMRVLTRQIGLHNAAHTFVFNHTSSEENKQFLDHYRKDYHLNSTSIGFYDDEQIGLAHTSINLNNRLPILSPNKKIKQNLPPVFIIGNGPSLDTLADKVKEYQGKAIIISCGTAISSLCKLGIKPDFQIESERGLTPSQWIKMGTDSEFRKGITLLALNTVSPVTTELFEKAMIAAKPNDIGNEIIKKEIDPNLYFELPFCNPTATNCGLSYAISMGFKEIYLIGTDFGMRNKSEHHSAHSIYNQIDNTRNKKESYDKTKGRDYTYSDNRYTVKGNFCDEVETTTPLDMSRRNMEIFLEINNDVVCHNPNDGAFIRGTEQTKPEDINIKHNDITKSDIIDELSKNHFVVHDVPHIDKTYILENYLPLLFNIKEGIKLPEKCDNMSDLYQHAERIFKNIEKIKQASSISYFIIKGSVYTFIMLMTYYCSKAKNSDDFNEMYQDFSNNYSSFIKEMYSMISSDPLRLDDTKIKNLPDSFVKKNEAK